MVTQNEDNCPNSRAKNVNDAMLDTLYYDGACPLCRREIKKLASYRKDDITLVDINTIDDDIDLPDKRQLMEYLHLKTAKGIWLTGVDANIRAWRNTPFEKLWLILRLPIIHSCASWCYSRWAAWRLKNRVS